MKKMCVLFYFILFVSTAVYADNQSLKIKLEMTVKEVISMLGKPSKSTNNYLRYGRDGYVFIDNNKVVTWRGFNKRHELAKYFEAPSGDQLLYDQAKKDAENDRQQILLLQADEMKKFEALKQEEENRVAHAKQLKEAINKKEYPTKFPLHQAVLDYNKPLIIELLASTSIAINSFDCYDETACDTAFRLQDAGKGLEIYNLLKASGGSTATEVKKFATKKIIASDESPVWECKTMFISDSNLTSQSFESRMNEMGRNGWELISQRRARTSYGEWGVEAYLKRKGNSD